MNPGTGKYERLLERCAKLDPVPTAVAHPCEETALTGAIEAAKKRLISPILVGPAAKIEAVARSSNVDLHELQIVDTPHSQASASEAVALIREGCAELLMKGSLHTDELLGAVVARDTGLRTGRRIIYRLLSWNPWRISVSARNSQVQIRFQQIANRGFEVQATYPLQVEGNYPYMSPEFLEMLRFQLHRRCHRSRADCGHRCEPRFRYAGRQCW